MSTLLRPEVIQQSFLAQDVERWREDIEMVNLEMVFYKNLFLSKHHQYGGQLDGGYTGLFEGIAEVSAANKSFQSRLATFLNRSGDLKECDSIHCENYFLDQHHSFKQEIEQHFSEYKTFKRAILKYLTARYDY
jgi:hypothetical protein